MFHRMPTKHAAAASEDIQASAPPPWFQTGHADVLTPNPGKTLEFDSAHVQDPDAVDSP